MSSSSKSRILPGSFSESNDGNVFFARGDQPVKRWDGLLNDYVDAGVPAPTTGLTLTEDTSSGNEITGTYYAFLRFLDSRGKVSNLSVISDPIVLGGKRSGIVESWKFTNINLLEISAYGAKTPLLILTSRNHGLQDDDLVRTYNHVHAGLWYVRVFNSDQFCLRKTIPYGPFFALAWAFPGGMTWRQVGGSINYSNVEVPTDSRVVKRQILRNKDGNVNTFYVDVEDTELTETSFTSEKTDSQLGEAVPLRSLDGTDLNVERHGEPPNFKRVIVDHYNRTFAAVNLVYSTGNVYTTNASDKVDGYGTQWTSSMVGRIFSSNDASSTKSYVILGIDEASQQLTLDAEYEGNTEASLGYSISPENSELITLHFSEVGLPESWDRSRALSLTDDPLSGEITGLMPMGPRLHILFENRTYTLNYGADPSLDGRISFAVARGCINQRCWIRDGSAAYILDQRGAYIFDGGKIQEISNQIQSVFTGESDRSIDWSSSDQFHASHDPEHQTIRWFVSFRGSFYPQNALTLNYTTGRWWIEEYSEPISASTVGKISDKLRSVWSGSANRVMVPNSASIDGMTKGALSQRGSATSATATRLTDNSVLFNSSVIGAPLQISEGKGSGQSRIIVDAGEHYLEVNRPFVITPDSSSYYQVGGFMWTYKTPLMPLASPPDKKNYRSFEIRFQPNSSTSTLLLNKYTDFSTAADVFEYTRTAEEGDGASTESGSADVSIDMTQPTGSVQQSFDGTNTPRTKRSRATRFQLQGVPNGEVHKIYSITVEGVAGQ